VAVALHVLLAEGEDVAGGAADHLLAEVDARDHLGDGVLHLEAGVHLQEEEFPRLARDDELHGAGRVVVHGPGGADGGLAHGAAHLLVDDGAGGLLDDLLVAALDGALPLGAVDDVPVAVAQHLDLDVPGILDVALHVDGVVAEGGQAFRLGGAVGGKQLLLAHDHPEALAAAARGCLHHDGVADLPGPLHRLVLALEVLPHAGHQGHAHLEHGHAARGLVAHDPDGPRVGADEGDARGGACLGEFRVLREEAVAGVDGVGPRGLGHLQDSVPPQVRLPAGGGADAVGLVRRPHVERGAVGLGIDGDGGDAQLLAGADDADGDLPPVGDQDLLEHGGILRGAGCRACAGGC